MQQKLIQEINQLFGTDLRVMNRKQATKTARHLFYYVMYKKSGKNLTDIGNTFKQDHVTVINANKRIQEILDNPKDKYHSKCAYIRDMFDGVEVPKQPSVIHLEEQVQTLSNEILDLKIQVSELSKGLKGTLREVRDLPEPLRENVLIRIRVILDMEKKKKCYPIRERT